MRAVYKYPIEVADDFVVTMPQAHRVIHVELQQEAPCMWVEVDTESPDLPFRFHVEGTGHPVAPGTEHVGSWVGEPFVWHLYENPAGRWEVMS